MLSKLKQWYRRRLIKRLAKTSCQIEELTSLLLRAQLVPAHRSDKGYAEYHGALATVQQELANLKRRRAAIHNLLGIEP